MQFPVLPFVSSKLGISEGVFVLEEGEEFLLIYGNRTKYHR